MKTVESITVSIGVDVETAVYDMFDIATDLNLLVSMVDETKAYFAKETKQRIIDTLITWIDCNEKGE